MPNRSVVQHKGPAPFFVVNFAPLAKHSNEPLKNNDFQTQINI
jgi:hypothetical protein